MNSPFKEDIQSRLKDPDFARAYGEHIARAELAVAITRARKKAGFTQQELARRIGKSQSYIAKLESGDANPTAGSAGRIFAEMGLKMIIGSESITGSISSLASSDVPGYELPARSSLLVREPRTRQK